ncbi:MAG: tRNA (adenosine(37)-N6)-dimethylallyltransferase MiaA [Verrucomicrobiales bacterium]|nr:MAG: tRNA (adenosine(37)-N6)-dimethylallyltransferase MiaA [Verrucomicrobiales bacterium]
MANPHKLHPPSSILYPVPRRSEAKTGRPIFLAGPTAVGKSGVALLLAEQIGGEIISVDSMQVYRGLDIGTAKPTPAELSRVPHHLIDVAELNEPFDAAKFVALANKAVAEIQSRGRTPIFCGGTGLYFRAYLEGIGDAPGSDEKLRAELEAAPLAELLTELEQRDPVTFARIDRDNARRVVRAVEVIRLTGKPFSEQRSVWNDETPAAKTEIIFALSRKPEDLVARIHARVDDMFALGLVAETQRLLELGLEQNKTAMQAIGYRQVVEHLRGERSLVETVELVKIKTRQYAKRQRTWFRGQPNVETIELQPIESAKGIVARLKSLCLNSASG